MLTSVGSLACIPSILAQNPFGRCNEDVDGLVIPFNTRVREMVDGLNANLPGARFVLIDVFHIFRGILSDPLSYGTSLSLSLYGTFFFFLEPTSCRSLGVFLGFSVIDRGCCGIGRNRGQITCLPFQTPCRNREQYVFWDAFHPTSAVNVILGRKAFFGGPDEVYPNNVRQLATMNLH